MAAERAKRPFWVDSVYGKHECYSYDDSGTVTASVNGREVQIVVPSHLANVRVFVTAEAEGMLFCFGRAEEKFNDQFCGFVMVARKVNDTRYEVGVWHELYPRALKHFGFEGEMR